MSEEKCFVWMKVEDLAEYILSHPEKDVGFTNDGYTEENDFEPMGWYGIECTNVFDGWSILIGYYGDGIDDCIGITGTKEEVCEVLTYFFKKHFNIDLKEKEYICVFANDVKG